MKILFLLTLVVLVFSAASPRAQALFGRIRAETERRQDAEQRVIQTQQTNEHLAHGNERLHTIITILSVGVVTALLVGAAVGSKARRAANQP